jgi:hypothetical protein
MKFFLVVVTIKPYKFVTATGIVKMRQFGEINTFNDFLRNFRSIKSVRSSIWFGGEGGGGGGYSVIYLYDDLFT